MLNVLFLILSIAPVVLVQVVKKTYTSKYPSGGALLFSAISCFFIAVFFVFSSGFSLHPNPALIPYVISFGISYGLATISGYYSIRTGPLSLTSLITSYSLVVPTIYGLVFLGDKGSVFFYIGLVFLMVSLFAIGNKNKNKAKQDEKIKITPIWIIAVIVSFLSNGLCSTFQTAQQKAFLGEYKNELMVLSLFGVAVSLFILSLFVERKVFVPTLKHGWPYALGLGIIGGASNLFVMLLISGTLPASVIFPTISAGGIIVTGLVALFVYKEKLSLWQIVGLVLGTCAVIFMNI